MCLCVAICVSVCAPICVAMHASVCVYLHISVCVLVCVAVPWGAATGSVDPGHSVFNVATAYSKACFLFGGSYRKWHLITSPIDDSGSDRSEVPHRPSGWHQWKWMLSRRVKKSVRCHIAAKGTYPRKLKINSHRLWNNLRALESCGYGEQECSTIAGSS